MSDNWQPEAKQLLGEAADWLREFAEEGIEEIDLSLAGPIPEPETPIGGEALMRPPEPATTSPAAPAAGASARTAAAAAPKRAKTAAPAASAPESLPVEAEPVPWGERPGLEEVRTHLGDCQRCGLCERRNTIVFGDGNPDADILFVGEGPGEQEDLQGLPFVGRAGELLTQMIEKGMGIPRSEVYICNIVKCRPPNNRNPLPPEVAACRPFLDGQIAAVRPRVIVSLGKPAASLLLGREVAITRMRGTWQQYGEIPLMPTLHPAFVLRQYTPENRRLVWEDLKAALGRARE